MLRNVATLYQYRELLWIWVLRTIKVRYKQSALGVLWALLQPLSLMLIFTLVFSMFVRVPTEGIPYPVFSYCALLPWTFFATSISLGINSLTNNMNLVTKIYFPREILPIGVVAAGFFDFLIGLALFTVLLVFYQVPLSATVLLLPVLLLVQIGLTLGVVLFASALNVFFRDIQFVVPLGIQLLMFATPVVYPVSLVPEPYRWIYMLNPMAALIQAYRDVTILGIWPNLGYVLPAAVVSLLVLLGGFLFFKRVEWQFADII